MSSAKFITNDLGSLPAALGPRTTDTNKNLAIQALEMVGDLGKLHASHLIHKATIFGFVLETTFTNLLLSNDFP